MNMHVYIHTNSARRGYFAASTRRRDYFLKHVYIDMNERVESHSYLIVLFKEIFFALLYL